MKKKGFTLIELIVVMGVLAILMLLAMPKYLNYTKDAKLTEIKVQAKELENASIKYYMSKGDWPRLIDTPYTADEIEGYGERILAKTGQVVTLEEGGNYYPINYEGIKNYVKVPKDKESYILQNPVGNVFYIEGLTENGKKELGQEKPPVIDEEDDGTVIEFIPGKNTYVEFGNLGVNVKTINIRFYLNQDMTSSTKKQTLIQYGFDKYQEVIAFGDITTYINGEVLTVLSGNQASSSSYRRTVITEVIGQGWHDMSIVWNEVGKYYDIYIDGLKKPITYAASGHSSLMCFDDFIVGKGNYDNFNGKIDKIVIWSVPNKDYNLNQGLTGDEIGLEGYWNFTSIQGDKVKDLSNNGRDGTVYNPQYSEK